ncbi:hypothetical protein C2E20_7044 [Micractinium conductrix]|uniref:Nudix hydrolase domain-containing protein n=1 Tax=Micractinium conductrix TaxID=554055 RepID=A0A2P6V608_9CHLO|nr:hypothetical protein C2E20_7044 [Micractinium conductrix]|eukprot:PSC69517.1 hypothetical protein C2E20_7044 [Micractinium conductrix]
MGEDGRPQREVSVLNVLLQNSQGQILYEDEQVLPNGARRARGLPLSEKLLPGERWQDAVVRGVIEELGPVLPADPKVEVDEGSMRETVETKESKSYPGLLSRYVCKRVSASVVSGLPEGAFATDEERSDGLLRHFASRRPTAPRKSLATQPVQEEQQQTEEQPTEEQQPAEEQQQAEEQQLAVEQQPAEDQQQTEEQPTEAQPAEQQQPAEQKEQEAALVDVDSPYKTGVFYTTGGEDGKPLEKHEMLDEPVPDDCFMEEHADYDGPALAWGLTHKLPSAAQCCEACKLSKEPNPQGEVCNLWVWCGSPTGECWSPDMEPHDRRVLAEGVAQQPRPRRH